MVGRGVGHVSKKPETLLGDYDLVFAKAKAAMEALAVGSAVVLCDFGGLGPMVTAADFDRLRPLNFGFAALLEEPTLEGIRRQIERYDRADARRVTELVRTHCGLEAAVRDLVDIYRLVIEEAAEDRLGRTATSAATAAPGEPTMSSSPRLAALRYRLAKAPFVVFYRAFGLGPRRIPGPLKLPYRVIRRVARRSVGVE